MPRGQRRRPGQVAEIVRQVLAEAIPREVRDPRVGLVTVTRVEVSGDLGHATVYVMAGKGEGAKGEGGKGEAVLEGLRSAAGFLRSRLARELPTRTVPELHFELDRGYEHAARINAVLADLKREGED